MKSKVPYGRQTVGLMEGWSAFRSTLGPKITQGPHVSELEDKICEFTTAKHAIAVSSGTAALHIAALAAKVDQFDETVVPGITFAATASSVLLAGGRPSLTDIDERTWNIDLTRVREDVKSIFSVDFAGLPSGVTERKTHRDAQIIEDCAHSLGASTPSGPVGGGHSTLMRCFSLHPVKAITAGEGGVVTTNDDQLAERLRELRSHGMNRDDSRYGWEYDIKSIGLNYRLTDIQAAIAVVQLKRLVGFIDSRNEIAERYRVLLDDVPVGLPPEAPVGYRHAYHLFPVLLSDENQRNFVYDYLQREGILVQVHYKPLHQLSVFGALPRHSKNLDSAENVGSRILSLPIFPRLRKSDQTKVVKALRAAITVS
jgi:perosamine synthetase